MKLILDEKEYDTIWNYVVETFQFKPSVKEKNTFYFSMEHKKYHLKKMWDEKQEGIVNAIFKEMGENDIYALDWQHDCFEFNARENIPLDYHYHDEDRECEVFFPSYAPNGDYHFFISKDWSYGLFGHPWKSEIYVFGDRLISRFEEKTAELDLDEIVEM